MTKKILKLKKAAKDPLREKVGKLTRAQVKQIAENKMEDLNATDVDAAAAMIAGTARSMGLTISGRPQAG